MLNHFVTVSANTVKYANNSIGIEDKWVKIESDVIRNYFAEIKKTNAILVIK